MIPSSTVSRSLPGSLGDQADTYPTGNLRPRHEAFGRRGLAALEELCFSSLAEQRERLGAFSLVPVPEIAERYTSDKPLEAAWHGHPINPVDILPIYGFIHANRPKRYVEIGSGTGVRFARSAIDSFGFDTRLAFFNHENYAGIDPLADILHHGPLNGASLANLREMEAGDVLFVDSTHVAVANSDATVILLEVIEALAPGVIVQFHDVFLPYDYPEPMAAQGWNEQYLLAAYLQGCKDRMEILLATAFLCRQDMVARSFKKAVGKPQVKPGEWTGGGSFWFTKRG